MDTSKDFRILLAEKGLNEISRVANSLKIQGRKNFVSAVNQMISEIQNVKYCYLAPEEIKDFESFKRIVELAKELRSRVEGKDYNECLVSYWLEYLESLPDLMDRGEISRIYEAIRFFSGEIVSKKKISDSLWFCLVDCGRRFDVVTNSEELANRQNVVVSYLPPRKFGDVISTGMFVDAELGKKGELSVEEIRSISDKLGEVESILISYLGQ